MGGVDLVAQGVGALVRAHRSRTGLTQEEVAERCGVSARSIREIEHGRRRPYPRTMRLLAEALELSDPEREQLLASGREPAGPGGLAAPAGLAAPPAERPPVRGWSPLCQLPPDIADFTGRAEPGRRLAAVLETVRPGRAVPVAVVAGLAGVGKTTLGLHAAHASRGAFADGQLFAELAGASARPRDPAQVLDELMRAMGATAAAIPPTLAERAALYRSIIADRRVLVFLDDAADLAQVRPLIPATAGCAVLVTSRRQLAALPGSVLVQLGPLPPAEAAAMLGAILGRPRVEAEPSATRRLAVACGGHPLALRITAARLATRGGWSLARYADLIADRRHRLEHLNAGELTMRGSLEISYQRLAEPSRTAFRRLALIDTRDHSEWAIAAALDDRDGHTARTVVDALADSSLLTASGLDPAGWGHYRMHELTRAYAGELAAREPESDRRAACGRVVSAYLYAIDPVYRAIRNEPTLPPPHPVTGRGPFGPEHAARLAADPFGWLAAERANVPAVIAAACALGRHDLAVSLGTRLLALQDLQGRHDEADLVWTRIRDTARAAGHEAEAARADLHLAVIACWAGRLPVAAAALARCAVDLRRVDDRAAQAYCLFWQAQCAMGLGNLARARRIAGAGLQAARDTDDRAAQMINLCMSGLACSGLGAGGRSLEHCEQAVRLARDSGEPVQEYLALRALATVHAAAGDHTLAMALAEQAMGCASRGGFEYGRAMCQMMLGGLYLERAQPKEAQRLLETSLGEFETTGARWRYAQCLARLAQCHECTGEYAIAAAYSRHSTSIFADLRRVPASPARPPAGRSTLGVT